MFIRKDKILEYFMAENRRLNNDIVQLYKDKAEETEKEQAGRMELALMCPKLNVMNIEEIRKKISEYLSIKW